MKQMSESLADKLKRLCCAKTEGQFFDCVTDNIDEIISGLRNSDRIERVKDALAWMDERAKNSTSFGSHCHAYEIAAHHLELALGAP
jgi:hypothetical protein